MTLVDLFTYACFAGYDHTTGPYGAILKNYVIDLDEYAVIFVGQYANCADYYFVKGGQHQNVSVCIDPYHVRHFCFPA